MDYSEPEQAPTHAEGKQTNTHSPKGKKYRDLIMMKMTNSNEFCNTYLSKQSNKLNTMNVKKAQTRVAKKTESPNGHLQTLNTNSSCNFNGPVPSGNNTSGIFGG